MHPADSAAGEGEQLCLQELRAFGDFFWLFDIGSLELEGFLAEVESGCFGVEVLELHPKLWWRSPLLLEHLVLGDSAGGSGVATLGGDCLDASGSLACQYEGAGGMGISPGTWRGESPTA